MKNKLKEKENKEKTKEKTKSTFFDLDNTRFSFFDLL